MLGILGLGSYSSLHYIKRLNEEYLRLRGGYSTLPFKMLNVDFNDVNPYLPDQFEKLIPILKDRVEALNQLEVSKILVPNITIHQTIDQINLSPNITNKFVHPIKILQDQKHKTTFKSNIILGSYYTMTSNYISQNVVGDILVLPDDEMKEIDNWRKNIYRNGVTENERSAFTQWAKNYNNVNFIIACTELSILVNQFESAEYIIDLAELQIINSL